MDFVLKRQKCLNLFAGLWLEFRWYKGTKVQRSIGKTLCVAYVYPLVNNLGCWRKKYDITFIYYFLTNSAIQKKFVLILRNKPKGSTYLGSCYICFMIHFTVFEKKQKKILSVVVVGKKPDLKKAPNLRQVRNRAQLYQGQDPIL